MKSAGATALPPFLRYAAVGALATASHYLLLVLAVQGLGAPPAAAAGAGAVLGAGVSYACNRAFTFAARTRHADAIPRFALVTVALAAANAGLVQAGIDGLRLGYLLAQVIATLVLLFAGFALHRRWSFA